MILVDTKYGNNYGSCAVVLVRCSSQQWQKGAASHPSLFSLFHSPLLYFIIWFIWISSISNFLAVPLTSFEWNDRALILAHRQIPKKKKKTRKKNFTWSLNCPHLTDLKRFSRSAGPDWFANFRPIAIQIHTRFIFMFVVTWGQRCE